MSLCNNCKHQPCGASWGGDVTICSNHESSRSPDVNLRCPCCQRDWPADCEQAICIEKHDECIVCRFTPKGCGSVSGTKDELDAISAEQKRRESS